MKNMQIKLLEKMKQIIESNGSDAILQRAGNDGYPVDSLNTLFDEGEMGFDESMGEFFFTPESQDDGLCFFMAVISLTNELPLGQARDLMRGINAINNVLPGGCFFISPDMSTLGMRVSLPVEADSTEDDLFDQMNIAMGIAILASRRYGGLLKRLALGQVKLPEFMAMFE